jgi:hypothetical protein
MSEPRKLHCRRVDEGLLQIYNICIVEPLSEPSLTDLGREA